MGETIETVGQLIEKLKTFSPDTLVFVGVDHGGYDRANFEPHGIPYVDGTQSIAVKSETLPIVMIYSREDLFAPQGIAH